VSADGTTCAIVQSLLRGASDQLDPAHRRHVDACAACRVAAGDYRRLRGELRALRNRPVAEDLRIVESIARCVDDEIGRRLRRTWALVGVGGGLAVAGAAGVASLVRRSRMFVAPAGA
jgi:hypothetical protein